MSILKKPRMIKVVKTKGNHSWVEMEIEVDVFGKKEWVRKVVRKENKNIPANLLAKA